ncbi:AbrB family transcriptional regulator [Microbispora cellulosiformans]|uniref:AbrB family transcriptional regulator n=1 Tax=Microbispora cellulosiformans TaxID=2614688 RepID=A0A5J5KBN5_9ACTN|nr:AbrB family transcriptional regulator [Microbispora cellulosiformans]
MPCPATGAFSTSLPSASRTARACPPLVRALRWPVALAAGGLAAELAGQRIPAPHLLVPMALGLCLALAGVMPDKAPRWANRVAQALLGVLLGTHLNPHALAESAGDVVPLTTVTGAAVVLGVGAAAILARRAGVDRASATLGMVAGGSTAVVASAEDLGADTRLVAFMQYLRVGLVAATAPVVIDWMAGGTSAREAPATAREWGRLVTGDHQAAGLLVLAVVAALGVFLGTKTRLPCPALLGPMLLTVLGTALVTLTGTLTEIVPVDAPPAYAPAGALRTALFTLVGLDVGLRFTRHTLRRVRSLLPVLLALTAVVSGGCAVIAAVLARILDVPFSDAYLATTPGGINAVMTTAVVTDADVSLISGVQSLRLFVMALLAPLLVRFALSVIRGPARAPGTSGPVPQRARLTSVRSGSP